MGLRVSSPSSAVLQGVTPSPWSYLDVQHRSADAWAGRRVDGTNAALSAARRARPRRPPRRAPPRAARPAAARRGAGGAAPPGAALRRDTMIYAVRHLLFGHN